MIPVVAIMFIGMFFCAVAVCILVLAKCSLPRSGQWNAQSLSLTIIGIVFLIIAVSMLPIGIYFSFNIADFDDSYQITSEFEATIVDKYEAYILEDKFIFDVAYNKKVISVEVSQWDYLNHEIGDNISLNGNYVYVNLER